MAVKGGATMNRNEFFQALPLTKLTLRLTGAALEICTDDIEDVHVMVSGAPADVEALRVQVSADTLTVEQPVSILSKPAASGSWLQIALRLPRSWKGALEARTVSGWMNIRAISGTDLSLDTVSGLIMAADMNFLTLSARSVTGDVKLNQVSCKKCNLFSTSGSLTVMRSALKQGSASTVTGLITLDLVSPFDELTLNSITGEICVDAPLAGCDAAFRSVSGRIRTSGVSITEGAPKLKATTVSSDLNLTNNTD